MRILIVTAHPDDAELSMGGTMSRLKREGNDIRIHVFSASLTIEGNEGIKEEVVASIRGIYGLDLTVHDYPTMHFNEHYQDIRDTIFKIKQDFNPHVVYTKSPNALHPDHRIIGEAVESIFLESTIYAVEGLRDFHNQKINKWFGISDKDLSHKLQSLKMYKTQSGKYYFDETYIKSLATIRGAQSGFQYAEGFEVIREVS